MIHEIFKIFNDAKDAQAYLDFIENANKNEGVYLEKHHILPKSIFLNTVENLGTSLH